MAGNQSDKQHTPDLWRFIRLDEYQKPGKPTGETVRKGISGLWTRLRRSQSSDKSVIEHENLHAVPQSLLDQAVARPDWQVLLPAVNEALKDWLAADDPDCSVQVVVGAPHSGVQEALTSWGASEQWRVVEAPPGEQILVGGEDWLAGLCEEEDTPMVISRLEGCYLRHYEGLSLINRMLDFLAATSRRCLIGCDSWAWAFLCEALQVDDALPHPFTLEPFDHSRLERWFLQLAGGGNSGFVFRQADNGKPVLPPIALQGNHGGDYEGEQKQANAKSSFVQESDFLKHLAAYSLGIPEVAWSIWRHSLRSSPIEGLDEKSQEGVPWAHQASSIWVKPWGQIDLPTLDGATDQDQLFVLHSLLVHRGLPADILVQLLPFSPAEVARSLHSLHSSGLVEKVKDHWQVTPLGYPAVRQTLKNEGYLVDCM
jgi:hypothetical protein